MDGMLSNQTDDEVIDTLRQKWQNHSAQVKSSAKALDTGIDCPMLANVHICQVCEGSGMKTEMYEFRCLESTCNHCHGEGILISGGRNAARSQHGIQHHSPTSSNGTQGAQAMCDGSKRKLQAQLIKLENKIDQVKREATDLHAALDVQTGSPKERALQQNLMEQLQQYLFQLQQAHSRKLAQMQ